MASTTAPHPTLDTSPFFTSSSSTTTTETISSTTTETTTTAFSPSPTTFQNNNNITTSQSSDNTSTSPTSPTSPHHTDGRRNSFGEILPSPTETWKPTFNRVQSWNREDRKREIVLKREIGCHEGKGGGFSEK